MPLARTVAEIVKDALPPFDRLPIAQTPVPGVYVPVAVLDDT
jgi:hypothetical protein